MFNLNDEIKDSNIAATLLKLVKEKQQRQFLCCIKINRFNKRF